MIGAPVTNVRTPALLKAHFRRRGVGVRVETRHVEPGDFDGFIREAKADLAVAIWHHDRKQEANVLLRDALKGIEEDSRALVVLGQARMKLRQMDAAIELFNRAIKRSPKSVEALMNLAIVRQMQGETELAAEQYRLILREDPNSHEALNNLAWIRATDDNPGNRNGAVAVSLARRLCQATAHQEPAYLDTLAAALAESGDFKEAIRITKAAIELARGRSEHDLADTLAKRLSTYTAGEAFRG